MFPGAKVGFVEGRVSLLNEGTLNFHRGYQLFYGVWENAPQKYKNI